MVKRAPSGALSVYFPLSAPPARGLYASSPMLACLGAQTSARSVSYAVLTCMQVQIDQGRQSRGHSVIHNSSTESSGRTDVSQTGPVSMQTRWLPYATPLRTMLSCSKYRGFALLCGMVLHLSKQEL